MSHFRARCRRQRKPQRHRPTLALACDLEARVEERAQHRVVLLQRVGVERRDTAVPSRDHQLVQEQRADAMVLIVVRDDEGDFRDIAARLPVVAGDADELVAQLPTRASLSW